ncbi:MAG: hypothetical protein WB696_25150, partial [Chthoniobacterales bacterium]
MKWQKDEERERKDTMRVKGHVAQTRHNATNGHCDILPRPNLKAMLTERRGRDVGFAKSGFRQSGHPHPWPS